MKASSDDTITAAIVMVIGLMMAFFLAIFPSDLHSPSIVDDQRGHTSCSTVRVFIFLFLCICMHALCIFLLLHNNRKPFDMNGVFYCKTINTNITIVTIDRKHYH